MKTESKNALNQFVKVFTNEDGVSYVSFLLSFKEIEKLADKGNEKAKKFLNEFSTMANKIEKMSQML